MPGYSLLREDYITDQQPIKSSWVATQEPHICTRIRRKRFLSPQLRSAEEFLAWSTHHLLGTRRRCVYTVVLFLYSGSYPHGTGSLVGRKWDTLDSPSSVLLLKNTTFTQTVVRKLALSISKTSQLYLSVYRCFQIDNSLFFRWVPIRGTFFLVG